MMRREMRARRRLGANSRSTDVAVTPWADEYVPAPCADLPTYPPCHAGAGARTYLPTPPISAPVALPTLKINTLQAAASLRCSSTAASPSRARCGAPACWNGRGKSSAGPPSYHGAIDSGLLCIHSVGMVGPRGILLEKVPALAWP